MALAARHSMHMRKVRSGFGTNNTMEPKFRREGWIQPKGTALTICLRSSASSRREMRYRQRNSILPLGSISISKSACILFCEFANVGSPKRPWNSFNISWNSPGGSSVWSVPLSPQWCTSFKKACFDKRADTFLSSAFSIMCMPMKLAYSTIPFSTSKGRRPGK